MSRRQVLWLLVWMSACSPSSPSKEGSPCRWYGKCDGLACVAVRETNPEDLAPLKLECAEARSGSESGEPCDDGTECASGVCLLAGACAEPCDPEFGCATGQRCALTYARTATDALQVVTTCVEHAVLPKDGSASVGAVKDALETSPSNVDLAATIGPTLFVVEHLDDERWPVDTSCRSPLCAERLSTRTKPARVLFDVEVDAAPINPVAAELHVYPVSVWIPNGTPAAASASSTGHALRLEHERSGDVRVTQLQREQSGERLDLNVYYVGAEGFEVTGARGPALLADALEEVDRILGQADLYIGEVRQIEVTGKLPTTGMTLESDGVETTLSNMTPRFGVLPLLPKLFSLSAGAANAALDVFFVADIQMPPGVRGDIHALTGGTPVPWGMHGLASSGIVIAADMMVESGDAKHLGRTLAHEIGHALGLFHPTEVDGRVLEPIDDTPACPIAQDTDSDGLDAADCAAHGGDNLMFPTADPRATMLTPDQRDVLRRALILQ